MTSLSLSGLVVVRGREPRGLRGPPRPGVAQVSCDAGPPFGSCEARWPLPWSMCWRPGGTFPADRAPGGQGRCVHACACCHTHVHAYTVLAGRRVMLRRPTQQRWLLRASRPSAAYRVPGPWGRPRPPCPSSDGHLRPAWWHAAPPATLLSMALLFPCLSLLAEVRGAELCRAIRLGVML